jgi:hypothetical protein
MNGSLRDISRFSAKAACRRRLIRFAIVFIVITLLTLGSALILAFDESAPPPTYTFEFAQGKAMPDFFNPFVKADGGESDAATYFSVSIR